MNYPWRCQPSGRQDRLLWAGSGSRGHALFILLLLVATCFQGRALAHQSKNVKVEVRAKWSGTPILLEAGELVAKESEEAFWLFVDRWLQARQEVSPGTDSECFQLIVNRGISTLGDQLGPLFRLSLMLRSASPKLVLFRQLAQESLTPSPLNSERLEAEAQGHAIDRWAVSRNPLAPQGKCCWVDVGTHLLFDELEISDWLKSLESSSPERNNAAQLFEFDHVFAGSNGPNYVVVLYGALGTVCFERVHPILAEAARQGLVKYVLRPVLPSGCEQAAGRCGNVGAGGFVNLGGYGVELALKNMEYTAIDDTDMRKGDLTDELRDDIGLDGELAAVGEVNSLNKHLLSPEVVDLAKVPELKDLGFQAVQKILGAPDALRTMQDINHNLPKLVSWLAHVQPNETIRSEIVSNQRLIQAGKNLIAINGALINTDTVDLHSLIELVQGELSIAVKIRKMKVPSLYVRRLLQIPQPSEQSTVRVDFRSVEFVHYLNNLEEDPMYRRWPNNMNQLLMPAYPGQLRYVRKNLYHAVYVVDPASASGLSIVDSMMNHYQNSVPMRFGLIFVAPKVIKSIELNLPVVDILLEAEKDPSSLAIQAFQYLKEHFGVRVAFQFLQNLVSEYEEYPAEEKGVSYKGVRGTFLEILKEHDNPGDDVLKEMQSSSYYREVPYKSSLHAHKLGVSRLQPCLLMNGLLYDGTEVEHAALLAMQDELPRIQEGVYYGTINSRTDVLNKFLSDGSFPRYNPQIAGPASKEGNYVSLAEHIAMKHVTLSRLQHIHSPGTEDEVKPITHWLALNLMKTSGWNLLREAVHYLSDGSSKGRVALLYNLEGHPGESMKDTPVNILFAVTTSPSRRGKIVPFLKKFLALKTLQNFAVGKSNEEELVKDALDLAVETGFNADYLQAFLSDLSRLESAKKQMSQEGFLLSTLFGLQPGLDAVITNGKVFVQESGKYFLAHDFRLLEVVNYEKRVKPVELIVSEVEWSGVEPDELTSDFLSTVILAISSTMAARSRSSESARFELLRGDHSAIIKHVNDTDIHVDAVIDPLSPLGQRLTPLLLLLQDWFNPGMRILLNPANGLTDLPLKNFYHYVAPVKEDYMTDGKLTEGPVGQFLNMPPTRTLTMNLDVPEPWLVEPVIAVHDLDNIVLQKLSGKTMSAVFELEALVVTGQCYENGEPPRGLQLLLGTRFAPHMVDTIVMANLGYWQLKAAPGVMTLKLAPGKSTELYTLKGPGEGTEAGPIARQLVIQSFQGAVVRLEVVKRKGKEGQKILDGDDDLDNELTDEVRPRKKGKSKSGLFKWATNFIGMGKESDGHPAPDVVSLGGHRLQRRGETINIFSIASGHLYERFLKIMMLSVLKNTRRPVKFWFIKNYLSPQFKDLIPQMADWYGFEYDLVTYKWPSWLHKQTEKQRLIWAYKILFLDVIFPLSLKKVIFVDADQIVRTDMGELYDMDIEGRPLAYTPFCDNNREMDGYRFWNQGFWRDHLRGRPYHISALYVVDLVRFRQSAAGDKLRVFYESLSKDPHSLSNLDQDLPNYAQHTVPIFSLPQQWLWCESWCGNSTKAQAKTIDLCNNPMTKEPKLEGARRIVDEWPALDEEVREFTARILHGDGVQPPSSPVSSEKPSTDADRDLETAAEL